MNPTSQKNKPIYRLPPCPAYEIEMTESWLTDMAAKGLFLSRAGFFAGFAIFEKSEPALVRYRLEAAPEGISTLANTNLDPTAEARELNASYGWQYVAARDQFYIYRSDSADARELNTDPRVQALALDLVRKRERANVFTSILWLLVYPIVMLRGQPLLTAVNTGSWLMAWAMILVFWALGRSVSKVVHLRMIRKKLASGEMLNHQKNWKQRVLRYRWSGIIFLLLVMAWVGCLLNGWSNEIMDTDVQSLKDYSEQLPFATIADLAPHGTYHFNNFTFSNTIEVDSDWLTPVILKYHENATVTFENGQYLQGGLHVNYYEAVSPWIARQIAREYQAQAKRSKEYREYDITALDVDYAVAYFNVFPTVIIQKGNTVAKVMFYQTSESYTMQFDEWAQIFANSIK